MSAFLRWLDPILNPLACLPPLDESGNSSENAEALLKRLDALLRQKLKYAMTGEKKSVLRGQGLDFADLREYQPGDDIRKMDWSVFARTLTPHVREYHEEKQLTLWLVVDLTPSMRFGRQKTKRQQAVELSGLFGLLAEQSGHKLGAYCIGTNRAEIIAPASGQAHLQHLTQKLLDLSQISDIIPPAKDPLPSACQQLCHVVAKRNTVILLSDFLACSDVWQVALGQLSHKARLLSLMLVDPVEARLPANVGLLTLRDAETGQTVVCDSQNPGFLSAYQKQIHQEQTLIMNLLQKFGPVTLASTEQDPLDILLDLLKAGGMAA